MRTERLGVSVLFFCAAAPDIRQRWTLSAGQLIGSTSVARLDLLLLRRSRFDVLPRSIPVLRLVSVRDPVRDLLFEHDESGSNNAAAVNDDGNEGGGGAVGAHRYSRAGPARL